MGHEPQLIPDYTLLLQLGLFFASYFVLKALIFNPYLSLLEERKAKTTGLREQADRDKERALKLQAEYEKFLKAERKKQAAWSENEHQHVNEEERAIIQKARDAVGEELQVIRTRIQSDLERARKDLFPLISEYSSQIASKLVGYKVKVSGIPGGDYKSESEHTVLQ
jgi:F0F1-type ATP synthase membrane subunit b/b'